MANLAVSPYVQFAVILSMIRRFGELFMKNLLWLLAFVLLVFVQNSEAYIDPGSGSYVLQLIVASFFAIVFALKMFWRNIKAFFSRAGTKKGNEQ